MPERQLLDNDNDTLCAWYPCTAQPLLFPPMIMSAHKQSANASLEAGDFVSVFSFAWVHISVLSIWGLFFQGFLKLLSLRNNWPEVESWHYLIFLSPSALWRNGDDNIVGCDDEYNANDDSDDDAGWYDEFRQLSSP